MVVRVRVRVRVRVSGFGLGLGALLLDDALEVVVDLGAHLHRLGEVLGADGQDHELLARVGVGVGVGVRGEGEGEP